MTVADEQVDVCDESGQVVGTATRAEMRAGRLWHRTVFIAVVTSDDRVWVHRRADWKDVWPGRWDVCFGGVLGAGEGFDAGAHRELAEEAGIEVAVLEPIGGGAFEHPDCREHARVYLARSDDPCTCPDGEVAEALLVPLADLAAWAAAHPVVADSEALVLPALLRLDGPGASPGAGPGPDPGPSPSLPR